MIGAFTGSYSHDKRPNPPLLPRLFCVVVCGPLPWDENRQKSEPENLPFFSTRIAVCSHLDAKRCRTLLFLLLLLRTLEKLFFSPVDV